MERELLSEAGLRPLKLGVRVADSWPLPARWKRGFEVDRCRGCPGIGDILVQMVLESGASDFRVECAPLRSTIRQGQGYNRLEAVRVPDTPAQDR